VACWALSAVSRMPDAARARTERNCHPRPVPAGSVDADTGPCQSGYVVTVSSGSGRAGGRPNAVSECRPGGGQVRAGVGDRLRVHANVVGHPGRSREIAEVRGAGREPPYLVRFDDSHTALVFPRPDAIIERPRKKGKKGLGCPGGLAPAGSTGGRVPAPAQRGCTGRGRAQAIGPDEDPDLQGADRHSETTFTASPRSSVSSLQPVRYRQ
jgi:hypothetical protein